MAIIGEKCEILWEVKAKSRDDEVLPNSHVLVTFASEVKEFTRDYNVVFHYKLAEGNKEISTAKRLATGNTMISEMGAKPRIIEIITEGKMVIEVPVKPETSNTHMQSRMARKLGNGNYLVPHLLAFAIKEYSSKGEIIRTIKTDLPELGGRLKKNWPFTAILLEDGRIMANLTNGNKTVIFDNEGGVDWVFASPRFADSCGGQFLKKEKIVASQYGSRGDFMPDAMEINSKKEVVYQFKAANFRGVHVIHVLTKNGKAAWGLR